MRYFECENCGQVVQGFEASRQVECCAHPSYVEIEGPIQDPVDFALEEFTSGTPSNDVLRTLVQAGYSLTEAGRALRKARADYRAVTSR